MIRCACECCCCRILTMNRLLLSQFLLFILISLLFDALVVPSDAALRILEEDAVAVDDGYFEYDLTEFSVRFEKCQYVKTFDENVIQYNSDASPLAVKHFAVYRLCPTDSCAKCDSTYGKYVVDIDTYLQATIENERKAFDNMCASCNERCNQDDNYCSGCGKICYQYDNLESGGYIDASQYTTCQQLQEPTDDGGDYMYIGPRCDSSNQIVIGLFADANCWEPLENLKVETVLGGKLSYHLFSNMRSTSSKNHTCLSCLEDKENEADQYDADEVNEMCEDLYKASAKCESKTGLETGFIQMNRQQQQQQQGKNNNKNNGGSYENQVENEFMACTFIDSLIWNSYTETGEINYKAPQDAIVREVTTKQAIALGFLGFVFFVLLGSLKYFQYRIDNVVPPGSELRASTHEML